MGFIVAVDHGKNIASVECTDVIGARDLMDYEREYWVGESHQGSHHCLDLRNCLLDIDFPELFQLAALAAPKRPIFCAGVRTAIVIADPAQEELALFYRDARHEFCAPEVRELAVFDGTSPAMEWLLVGAVLVAA